MTFLILAGVGYGIYRYATLEIDENDQVQEPTWASSFFERTIHK